MKKAFITGITGQDGSYLAEYLLSSGYEVHGLIRRIANEIPIHRTWRINHILDKITLHSGSINNYPRTYQILKAIKPDEVYHLAAQSFVSTSFEDEFTTMQINIDGTHNVLSALKEACPNAKFYFAGSSEMFGEVEESPQDEKTPFHPRSVYGISKVTGFELTRHYREAYNIFACTGILFNHESPRRGLEFVTRKITHAVAKITIGYNKVLRLGNIEAQRDWGFAGDYVKAMHLMMQQETPDDYVIGTGETHSVKEFLETAFEYVGLDYKKHYVVDPKFFRPCEVELLLADATKALKFLKWEPMLGFKQLIEIMVESDMRLTK